MSEAQLVIIGIVASSFVWILRQLNALGTTPKKEVVAAVIYVASFALAIFFTPVSLPAFGVCTDASTCVSSVLQWLADFVTIASPVAGFAYLIYNVLLQRVLEGAKSRLTRKG